MGNIGFGSMKNIEEAHGELHPIIADLRQERRPPGDAVHLKGQKRKAESGLVDFLIDK